MVWPPWYTSLVLHNPTTIRQASLGNCSVLSSAVSALEVRSPLRQSEWYSTIAAHVSARPDPFSSNLTRVLLWPIPSSPFRLRWAYETILTFPPRVVSHATGRYQCMYDTDSTIPQRWAWKGCTETTMTQMTDCCVDQWAHTIPSLRSHTTSSALPYSCYHRLIVSYVQHVSVLAVFWGVHERKVQRGL